MSYFQHTYSDDYLLDPGGLALTPAGDLVKWRESIVEFNEEQNELRANRLQELVDELDALINAPIIATTQSVLNNLRRAVVFRWQLYLKFYIAAADQQACRKAISALQTRRPEALRSPLASAEVPNIDDDILYNEENLPDKTAAMELAETELSTAGFLPFLNLVMTFPNCWAVVGGLDCLDEVELAQIATIQQNIEEKITAQNDTIEQLALLNIKLERLHETLLSSRAPYLFKEHYEEVRDLETTRKIKEIEKTIFAAQAEICALNIQILEIRLAALPDCPPDCVALHTTIASAINTYTALQQILVTLQTEANADLESAVADYNLFSFDTAEKTGIGVVQPQSGLDYPFVQPPDAIINGLIADFYVSYDDLAATPKPKQPFKITWVFGFGNENNWPIDDDAEKLPSPYWRPGLEPRPQTQADVIIKDADNNVVFNSTRASDATVREWSDNLKIIEWRGAAYSVVCRAVARKKQPQITENGFVPKSNLLTDVQNATLDARTVEKIPKRVVQISIQNGDCVIPSKRPWFDGKISFVNGYNTEIEMGATTTVGLRRTTPISFSADPGSGLGQYGLCDAGVCQEETENPDCYPVVDICKPVVGEEIVTLNGAKPDAAGNINIGATDCLWFRKPATYTGTTPHNYVNVNNNQLRSVMAIGADCAPCCACEDYLEAAQYMTNLGAYYRDIGARVTEIKTIHEENINRWEQQRECRNRRPFELLLVPQPCPCLDVVLFYCNHCAECAENVVLTVQFTATPVPQGAALDVKHTKLVADGRSNSSTVSGGWPVFSVRFPTVDAGASVYSQFRLCFCPQYPYAIKGTLTGVKRGGPILAGCTKTAQPAIVDASQILDCEVPIIVTP